MKLGQWLYDQMMHVAGKQKSSILAAANFNAMNRKDQIEFMKKHVFTKYKEAGQPKPFTAASLSFTSNFFREFKE